MTYCLSWSYSCFSSFSFSILHSCFMNTSIHISFSTFSLFHAYYIWHFIYLESMMSMKSHLILIFLFLYESTLLMNWNQSNRIIQNKVMAFSCQTSRFTRITLGTVFISNFSGILTPYLTLSLHSILNIRL